MKIILLSILSVFVASKRLDIPLLNLRNIFYSATLDVGTNKVPMNFIIDTGQEFNKIAGHLHYGQPVKIANHAKTKVCFNPMTASPIGNVNSKVEREFNNKTKIWSVEGYIVQSLIEVDSLQTTIQYLLVDDIKDLPDFIASGVIGLGKRVEGMTTLPTLLFNSGEVQNHQFSLFLSPDSCQTSSVLSIGGHNSAYFHGKLNKAASKDPEYWQINFDDAKLGEEKIKFQARTLLIDSGTTKTTLHQRDLELLKKSFHNHNIECHQVTSAQPLSSLECEYRSSLEEYPTLEFKISEVDGGHFDIKLTPDTYLDRCYFSLFQLQIRCLTNFQIMNENTIVLGVVFMQKYYTSFDLKNMTIGFAPVKQQKINKPRDFIIKSYSEYVPILYLIFGTFGFLNIFYCLGKSYIYSRMDLYASVLENSSARSDQEMSNIKPKQTITQMSVPTSPHREDFKIIPSDDNQG